MLFNSATFFIFLVLALTVRFTKVNWALRKSFILLLSYVFYAAWSPSHLLILWGLTLSVWLLSRKIEETEATNFRKLILGICILVSVLPLLFYKYLAFGIESLNAVLGVVQSGTVFSVPKVLLPIGISFYTFEAISFAIDTYRKSIPDRVRLLDFALFLAFFPRMVAGPIMRASVFLPQCEKPTRVSSEELGQGLTLIVIGLFEKVVLADCVFAPVADKVFAIGSPNDFYSAWIGTIAFAFQIYFDFAGYSTVAIGVAQLLGFHLPVNFHSPYSARGLSDFWRRWHISLSSWLRDYIYIPLGGNRISSFRTNLNLMMTMSIGGFWHGAALRFIAWGVLHGFYLVVQRGLSKWRTSPRISESTSGLLAAVVTFLLVCLGWVFFRATSLRHGIQICTQLLGGSGNGIPTIEPMVAVATMFLAVVAFLLQWFSRDHGLICSFDKLFRPLRIVVLAGMIVAILLAPGDSRAFIYFHF